MDNTPTPAMSEWRVGVIGAMLVALGPVSMALYTPAMPELVRDFGSTDAVIKLTLSLYFFGFAVSQLVAGPLSDAFGRRPVSLAFVVIFLAASIVAAFAPQVEVLLGARLVQGIGASAGIATSRAIVRDLYTGDQSARIMNMIGLLLGLGPALAPTIGGLTLIVASWRAIFFLMVGYGVVVMLVITFAMRESVEPDRALIRPSRMLTSYARLLSSGKFIAACLTLGGSIGTIYALATVLPFVLIDRVGLSPQAFGIGMITQSGSFLIGSLIARSMISSHGADALVPFGLCFIVAGALLVGVLTFTISPGYLSVMGPVGVYAFGIAFVMPAMMTSALHPFPTIAGAASALAGFIQMGFGFLGGALAATFADPLLAMAVVVPGFAATATAGYLVHRMLAGRTPPDAEPRGKLTA